MQNILGQLQKMIKTKFGFESQLDLFAESQSTEFKSPFGYQAEIQQLHVPIYDRKKEKIIATFKVYNVDKPETQIIDNINDLVHVTLQSYMDLMNKLDMTTHVLSHMQTDAAPQKIIPLHRHHKIQSSLDWTKMLQPEKDSRFDVIDVLNREILIFGRNQGDLQKLFIHLHEVSKNNNMITLDGSHKELLSSAEELNDLSSTTIIIPNLKSLTEIQVKLLTQLFKSHKHKEQKLMVAASIESINLDAKIDIPLIELLKEMHFFYVISDQRESHGASFATLQVCAEMIVQMVTSRDRNEKEKAPYTRSYNIVPLLKQFPTLLH